MKTETWTGNTAVGGVAGKGGKLKLTLAIIGGVVLAFITVFVSDTLFHALPPSPAPPTDVNDREAMRRYVASQPAGALLAVVAGWTFAALAGSALAARFGGHGPWPGWLVTALFLLATVANFLLVVHPAWMVATAVVLIVAAGWCGSRLAGAAGSSPTR